MTILHRVAAESVERYEIRRSTAIKQMMESNQDVIKRLERLKPIRNTHTFQDEDGQRQTHATYTEQFHNKYVKLATTFESHAIRDINTMIESSDDSLRRKERYIVSRISQEPESTNEIDNNENNQQRMIDDDIDTCVEMGAYRTAVSAINKMMGSYSAAQLKFLSILMAQALPLIFKGNRWDKQRQQVTEFLGIHYNSGTLGAMISAPRRFGKTTAISAFMAAMLMTGRGIRIVAYGAQKHAASGFIRSIGEKLTKLMPRECIDIYTSKIVCRNKEFTNVCVAPGNNSGRGEGGDIIVCDEIAFMSEKFIHEAVLPPLQLVGSFVVGISTPSTGDFGRFEHYLNATDAGDDGKKMFETYEMREDKTNPINPDWTDDIRRNKIKQLYMHDTAGAQREMGGLAVMNALRIFDKNGVDFLFKERIRPHHRVSPDLRTAPQEIFIAIDPSGGGDSMTACVSFFFEHASVTDQATKLVVSLLLFKVVLAMKRVKVDRQQEEETRHAEYAETDRNPHWIRANRGGLLPQAVCSSDLGDDNRVYDRAVRIPTHRTCRYMWRNRQAIQGYGIGGRDRSPPHRGRYPACIRACIGQTYRQDDSEAIRIDHRFRAPAHPDCIERSEV